MTIIILLIAISLDFIAIIPFLGLFTNPVFGLILYFAYGEKVKPAKGMIAGLAVNIFGDLLIFLSWLPTNLGQAIYAIILNKKNKPQQSYE